MVKIISLKAENFRRLNLAQPLKFPAGFIAIKGRNEAGKSTIIEAILFGLYGDFRIPGSLRGGRQGLESLVNYRAGRAKVEVIFEVGGTKYRVERIVESDGESARQIDAKLIELTGSEAKLLATGVTKVNEMVQKILRISWREMLATNVIAQKDLERIIRMNKADRDQVINMMMGFESYNKALEKLNEEAREKRNGLEAKQREREDLAKWVTELEREREELEKWKIELRELTVKIPKLEEEAAREEIAYRYLSELEAFLVRKHRIRLQLDSTRSRVVEIEKRLSADKVHLEQLGEELKQLKRERVELEPRLNKVEEELKEVERGLDWLTRQRVRIEDFLARRSSLIQELEDMKNRIASLREKLSKGEFLEFEKASVEQTLADLRKVEASVRLPAWSTVGAFFTVVLSLLATYALHPAALAGLAVAVLLLMLGLQSRQRQLQHLARKAEELKGRSSSIEAELRMLKRDAEELEALSRRETLLTKQLEELSSLAVELGIEERPEAFREKLSELEKEAEARRKELSSTVNFLKSRLYQLSADMRSRESEANRLQEEIEKLNGELHQLNLIVRKLEEEYMNLVIAEPPIEIAGLPWPPSEANQELVTSLKLKREKLYMELKGELERTRGRSEELKKRIEETEEKLKKLPEYKARLGELDREIGKLDLEVRASEEAINALKRVTAKRRAAFAPSVENNMSWIISYITNSRYKAVRIDPESYDVEIYDSEAGRWLRRDIYSGGTNDQFLLAIRIAFTLSLLPAAKGTYPRFLFLDEPLGSSDSERRDLIVKLLNEELTRFFDQVFLVTHVEVDEPPGSMVIVMENGKLERVYSVGSWKAE